MARVEKAQQVVTGKTLAEIAEERKTLDEFVAEHEGEITDELADLFADHEMERTQKVERIGYIITDEEAQVEMIDAQMKRLAARKQAAKSRIDWLQNRYLARLLIEMGMEPGDKVKGALATVTLQLNNPRLDGEVPEETLIDWKIDPARAAYVRYIPEAYQLDRPAFLTAAKLDPTLLPEGVAIVRDVSVRVK